MIPHPAFQRGPVRVYRPVLTSQAKQWRADDAQGVSVHEMARASGRNSATIYYHLGRDPLDALRARAARLEGLFAACNRALAGAAR